MASRHFSYGRLEPSLRLRPRFRVIGAKVLPPFWLCYLLPRSIFTCYTMPKAKFVSQNERNENFTGIGLQIEEITTLKAV